MLIIERPICLYFPPDLRSSQTQVLVNGSFRAAEVFDAGDEFIRSYGFTEAAMKVRGIGDRMSSLLPEQRHGARHVGSFRNEDERRLSHDGRNKLCLCFRVARVRLQNNIVTTQA